MLMIHFAQQSSDVAVSQPFPQVALHEIIASMLRGSIQSAPDLEAWLKTRWPTKARPQAENAVIGTAIAKP
jgi:hypothetical protein